MSKRGRHNQGKTLAGDKYTKLKRVLSAIKEEIDNPPDNKNVLPSVHETKLEHVRHNTRTSARTPDGQAVNWGAFDNSSGRIMRDNQFTKCVILRKRYKRFSRD